MKTRRFVRRSILAAAASLSSGLLCSLPASAFDSEVGKSGIQQVQHQAPSNGQPAPPAGTVEQELQKLFTESGQPMPSMRQNELPNAQNLQQGTVRPKAPTPPAKKNFLQKFVGKITGQEKKAAEAAVVPPVPPDYQEPTPAPPAGGAAPVAAVPRQVQGGQPNAVNPNMRSTQMPRNVAAPNAQVAAPNGQRPVAGLPAGNGTRVVPNGTRPQGTAQVQTPPNGNRVPQVPQSQPAAGGIPARVAANSGQNPQTGGLRMQTQPGAAGPTKTASGFVQPGSSPAFMTKSAALPAAIPGAGVSPATASQTPPLTIPRQAPDDDFADPFEESGMASDEESLDLDSLVEKSSADTGTEVTATETSSSPAEVSTTSTESTATAERDGATPFSEGEVQEPKPEENPFTGVRLSEDEEPMFDPSLATPATGSAGTASQNSTGSATLPAASAEPELDGAVVPPVQDFESELPALALPPVEESEPVEAGNDPMLNIPNLDSESANTLPPVDDSADASAPGALSTTPANENTESTGTGSSSNAQPAESQTSSGNGAEAERLQQAAEQDRRMRQLRLIQSRSGQTGFKGFCPVALRDRRDLVDAQAEYSATFGLQNYTFSSAEARAAFEADPSRYAPAAGGNDVVVLVNSGEEQPGMLEYALWYRDRLYMFQSRETMTLFNKDPQKYANQY